MTQPTRPGAPPASPAELRERSPWLRKPSETGRAFDAFDLFLHLGPERSITAAWERYREARGLKASKVPASFRGWARNHSWAERAAAFDADQLNRDDIYKAAVASYRESVAIALEAQPAVIRMLADGANSGGVTRAQVAAATALLRRTDALLDRLGLAVVNVGPTAGGTLAAVDAENVQFNFDFSGLGINELSHILTVLAPDKP